MGIILFDCYLTGNYQKPYLCRIKAILAANSPVYRCFLFDRLNSKKPLNAPEALLERVWN